MRNTISSLLALALIAAIAIGCGNNKRNKQAAQEAVQEEPATVEQAETYLTAIEKFLTDSIGSMYSQGEMCIPYCDYISADESNPDDIVVLGDFWVMNYNQAGDTLKTVSGGNHPGKLHIIKDADGHYSIASFEVVEDGSKNTESAKRIFADKYPEYQAAQSNDREREIIRAAAIAKYVREHGIAAKLYQDYGWPAIELPTE